MLLIVHILNAIQKLRAQVCDIVMLTSATDLARAFDACSLEGVDKALKEALPAPWTLQEGDRLDTLDEGDPTWHTYTRGSQDRPYNCSRRQTRTEWSRLCKQWRNGLG